MHLKRVEIHSEDFPDRHRYPFNVEALQQTTSITFDSPVTLFVGENGTGKSTLLEAIALKCGVHIWRDPQNTRFEVNPHEGSLHRFIAVEWVEGHVPGSFFASEIFQDFTRYLEEWAVADERILRYFGGKSMMTQSHGQSVMSLFRARYRIKGIYFMDEPETALSPKSQVALLNLLNEMGGNGHAQFIVATHSPIILACPGASILSFDHVPLRTVDYEETEHFRLYRDFLFDRGRFIQGKSK